VQGGRAQKRAHIAYELLADAPAIERWSRRARFLFIVGAAALCWAVPGAAIYLLFAAF